MNQIQRRIPILTRKYFNGNQHQANKIIPLIIKADPTSGKYTEWLIRQWKKGTAKFPEDNNNLFKNLTLFHQKKSKLTDKDINNYTPASLAKVLDQQFNLTKSERRKARSGELQLPPGAIIAKNENNLIAVKITTPEAASQLSSGTEWCTATINNAKNYFNKGLLYLIYRNNKREYLVHYESKQFMDTYNEEVEPKVKFEIVDFLSSVTGLSVINDPKLAYNYALEVIKGRFPEGEKIITTSADYSYHYAKNIIKGRWLLGEIAIAKNVSFSYHYAKNIIKGRFSKGEKVIATSVNNSYYYATNIIKGRFPEGEIVIATSADYSYWYAHDIIKGRWIKGEDIITKDVRVSYMYATNIIKGRFPEGEIVIATRASSSYNYAINIIKGRFPESEETIATSSYFSYNYAKNIIKGQWSKGEAAIAKNAEYSYYYAKDVIKGRFLEGEKTIMNNNKYREPYKDLLRSIKN